MDVVSVFFWGDLRLITAMCANVKTLTLLFYAEILQQYKNIPNPFQIVFWKFEIPIIEQVRYVCVCSRISEASKL